MRKGTATLALLGLVFGQQAQAANICEKAGVTSSLRYVEYFHSRVQDAPGCAMRVVDGHVVVDSKFPNPAMSCPDMFAWKLYAEIIMAQYWRNWSADPETWPGNGFVPPKGPASDKGIPYPLCQKGQPNANCCDPDSTSNPGYDDPNYKAKHCPYFPGDQALPADAMPVRVGMMPSKAHTISLAANPAFRKALNEEADLAQKVLDGSTTALDASDGREIRQSMAEIVFRNKSFFDYVFRSNLYNTEGITKVFKANATNISGPKGASGTPYRLKDDLSEIVFPIDAIMVKSNWLSRERAEKMGLRDDPQNPYIKMNITTPVLDNNGVILKPGEHWLLSFHISSKDIPDWVWTTFEHVNNPGRCDYTGCNDSYGYRSPDDVAADQARNFTRPHEACDDLLLPSYVFDTGGTYPGGSAEPGLATVFKALGIGTADNPTLVPRTTDRAWLSYRLKGSQTDFTDATGRRALLGNSVTEAGFVTSSSCMTCHARAGTNASGTTPPPLGVFENGLTESGYLPSSNGVPNPDWFNRSGQPPTLQVLQTDFSWGFLLANSINPPPMTANAAAAPEGPRMFLGTIRDRIHEQ